MSDKKTTEKRKEELIELYDEVPYESHPFEYTRPEVLHTIGTLFGMKPAAPETARVLEMGCASGNNSINFALQYPKAKVVGVDLSKPEIEKGQKMIKELGVKNLDLRHLSIADLDESIGKFDYIICHGIYSWVPKFVREKIMECSNTLLNEQGLAFISYNTLPGWNMVNTVREMMLFHSEMFNDVHQKLQQSKLFLNFVNEGLEKSKLPYANFLREQTAQLSKQADYYLIHEYLGEENTQFYFHQVMDEAKKNGLSYLADVNLHTMFIGNLPKKAADRLAEIDDIVRTEQYMDFITNRRFRSTILCKNNLKLDRAINTEKMKAFYSNTNIGSDEQMQIEKIKDATTSVAFYFNGDKARSVSTSSPIMKAAFYTYMENIGNPLKFSELVRLVMSKISGYKQAEAEAEIGNNIARLLFAGLVTIRSVKPQSVYEISKTPKVNEHVRYQMQFAKGNGAYFATNQVNGIVPITAPEKSIVERLDGKIKIEELYKMFEEKINSGELKLSTNDKPITDKGQIKAFAKDAVDACLAKLKNNYLLIA